MEVLGLIFIGIGTAFILLGVWGVLFYFRDAYERLHGTSKVGTLGLVGVLIGVAILQPEVTPKVILLILFAVLTAPVASHAIAGAAHAQHIPPHGSDALRDDIKSGTFKSRNPKV